VILRPLGHCLLCICLLLLATPLAARELHVGAGQPYATIQAAVNASAAGDVVLVHDGLYVENVVVDRRIFLRSLDFVLHGENDGAVVDGSGALAPGILVRAAGAVVEGFTVHGAVGESVGGWMAGIAVADAAGCRVTGNRCGLSWDLRNSLGIALRRADDAVVDGNEIAFGIHGIWIEDSAGSVIRGNDIHDHISVDDASGLHVTGQSVKSASTTQATLITENQLRDNNVGIRLEESATHARVAQNTIADGFVGVVVGEGCVHAVIAGNTVRDQGGRGIHLNGGHHATVVNNRLENCAHGIWLGFSEPFDDGADHTLVLGNTIVGSSQAGLRISAASDGNRIYLNHFANNATHVAAATVAAWGTPTPVSYFLLGSNHGAVLGNHYDTYHGQDLDGDGVGDTGLPFRDGDSALGPLDEAPLIAPAAAYDLQVWYLDDGGPAVMRRGGAERPTGEVAIRAGESVIWASQSAAPASLTFANGAWAGWLRWALVPAPGAVTVQVGATPDGRAFAPSGAQVVLGGAAWNPVFTTPPAPVSVPNGWRLALRVFNSGPATCRLRTGGG
jgi:nitrous oxidase accessory protein